jgi:hypothetical protein
MRWRKSSYSAGNNGECVEVSYAGAVRDSKNPAGPALRVDLGRMVAAARQGQLDR